METRKLSLEELGRLEIDQYKDIPKVPVIVILDNIRSALNVGSIFRTSDCLAIEKLILCGITAKPPHKEIFKTAIGATESVEWEYYEDINAAIDSLQNTTVISIEQTTNSVSLNDINQIDLKQNVALVMGNEVQGVSENAISKSDYCIEIPQYGTKHSFNVSVCAGIVLWEFTNLLRT
jgi:tRNA G18 (ribose-2'-O)-methylase SpoU